MKENRMSITVSTIVFVAVIVFLVFITINNKKNYISGGEIASDKKINMGNTQQIEGVKITILEEGKGDVAKSGNTVAMNYTGKLADGTIFDSNIDLKFGHVEPFPFTIGAGKVIKGWDIGVAGMKVGEKRILEIAPEYAYGLTGAGGVIPPNATISFEVELLQIIK